MVEGIVARSLDKKEPIQSDQLNQDPAVAKLSAFESAATGVCLPIRSGYDLFGFIILAGPGTEPLAAEEVILLNAITDLAVPSLQIEQLRNQYTARAWKMLEAEDSERLAVARKLAVVGHSLWKTGEIYDPWYQSQLTAA